MCWMVVSSQPLCVLLAVSFSMQATRCGYLPVCCLTSSMVAVPGSHHTSVVLPVSCLLSVSLVW